MISRLLGSRGRLVAAYVWGLVALAVAAVAVVAAVSDELRVKDLVRDPATLSGEPVSDGVLTWLSAFAWSATVTVVLLGAWLLHRTGGSGRRVRFLAFSAVVTAVLAVDDIFLGHERLAPGVGIAEEVLFAAYMVAYLVFLREFRDVVRETDVALLIVSLVFFAASLAVALGPGWLRPPFWLLPDTYTFLGVGGWLAFHLHTVVAWLEPGLPPGPTRV